jgi:aryl-alcohol dehydrogenase-like predicted oxidoreductase
MGSYRLLGHSGLRVSPLSLGTMTFGTEWKWGADRSEARKIYDIYLASGGNFIDTAAVYTNGTAERLLGEFCGGTRSRLVIATKYTIPSRSDDPNAGGNHRKSMMLSVEASLRSLATDYIDLLYLHAWDGTTPIEEILRGMDDLVRSGKVLYLGVSNTIAWQISRMQATASLRGWSPLIALQIEYNLVERTAERELIPMALEMGLGVIPWSPLAGGILTGKYTTQDVRTSMQTASFDGVRAGEVDLQSGLTARNLSIVDALRRVASEIGKTPAQVALAWTLCNPAVISPIVGARTAKQFEENIQAVEIQLAPEHHDLLCSASSVELGYPHHYLAELMTSAYMRGPMNIVSVRK